jgi:hypothetical protein
MKNWYKNLTKQQKIFAYALALVGPWVAGVTADSPELVVILYVPLCFLIFLHLGQNGENS